MRHRFAAALALSCAPLVFASAQQPAPPKEAARATGALPAGWKARLDDPAAKRDAVTVTAEKDSLTFRSGPGGIYYSGGMKAEKDYEATATFSELKPSTPPQGYGLFVAGADLESDAPRYTAFLIRGDGQYQIVSRTAGQERVIVPWRHAAAMADPKGVKTSNTLSVRALQGAIHFLIGQKEVHQMPRAAAGADGIAGLRIGPNLQVQVDKLSVKKFP